MIRSSLRRENGVFCSLLVMQNIGSVGAFESQKRDNVFVVLDPGGQMLVVGGQVTIDESHGNAEQFESDGHGGLETPVA